MTRSGLNTSNAAFALVVAATGAAQIVISGMPWWKFLVYTFPLLLFAVVFYAMRKRIAERLLGGIFIAAAAFAILAGDQGNLTGAPYLFVGLYLSKSKNQTMVAALTISALAVIGKAVFAGYSVPQVINYIAGFGHLFGVMWVVFVLPSRRIVKDPDADWGTSEVVRLLIEGLSYKEIADRQCVTEGAIKKRLYRERKKYGARNNFELIHLMTKRGHIA